MIPAPEKAAKKEAFRFPSLISLVPKRRFRASQHPSPKTNEVLIPVESSTPRRARLKKTGHLSLRWPDKENGDLAAYKALIGS